MVTGGKDPDDVLREQGPAALKSQLSNTTPFVDALFRREKELEPLDTPERRTSLKVRLRTLAATIADKDLAQAYREDLLSRYEGLWPTSQPVYNISGAAREMSRKRWDGKRTPQITGANAETKTAATALRSRPRPLSAALALAAINDPHLLDDKVELLATQGFCDDRLSRIAEELVSLRFETDHPDSIFVRRRLEARGFDQSVFDQLAKAAQGAGAAFLAAGLSPQQARDLWSRAFQLLVQLEALERAVTAAKVDMERDNDSGAFMSLKTQRDALKRLLDRGDWHDDVEAAAWLH